MDEGVLEMIAPILITGCARSGTSLSAGVIDACGAFGGMTTPARAHNRKGQFENDAIRNTVIKSYLLRCGFDPMGQFPLPNIKRLKPFPELSECIETIMIKQGYSNGPWYYKGAKMCLIWPVLEKVFPEAKWIIVRRKEEDIINSCLKTHFMRAYDCEEGWQLWINEHLKRFEEMQANLEVREIWPMKFVKGDLTEIKEVIKWLGLNWNGQGVKDFIDPTLWDTKKDK